MLLNIILILSVLNNGVCRKESMYRDLFRQGKSFLSRSFGYPSMNAPLRAPNFIAQRDGHYYGLELFDNSVINVDDHHPDPDQDAGRYQANQNYLHAPPQADKDKNDYKIIYHTDVFENDNMDLYQIIGGISFASLLAATILILGRNRRNNTLTKSFEEISRSSGPLDGYNNIIIPGEEILTRLSSQQFKLTPRKLSRKKQKHNVPK